MSQKADVSSVSPFVRANGGIVGCVWVHIQKAEPRYWWEHGDEENTNKFYSVVEWKSVR